MWAIQANQMNIEDLQNAGFEVETATTQIEADVFGSPF